MARIIWDNTYANADSSVFEVISKGTIIRAYGLGNVKATLYSLYGPQGAFLTVPYSQDLLSVLDADHNEVVVNSSGRFKLVLDDYGVAATNGVILTTDIQDVTATADVPQPSGAQANRPNVLVDTFKIPSLNTSPVIEITDEAWLFVAYGNELNVCQVVTVVGEGANEVEAPFIVNGVPVFMDADHRVLKIARSGRYRIKPYDTTFGANVLIIGNPSTVTTEEIDAGVVTSGGDIAGGKDIMRAVNLSGAGIEQGDYIHFSRGFKDNKYDVANTGIVKADCDKRLAAHGFALEDIDNGESGWIATNGANYFARIVDGSDTLTPPIPYDLGNGLFYLGADGGLLIEPPETSSLLQAIGGYSQEVFSAPVFSSELMYPEIYDIVMPAPVNADLNGTEYINDGTFANGLNNWEPSTGWTAGANSAVLDAAVNPNGTIGQDITGLESVPVLNGEGGVIVSFSAQQSDASSRTVIGIGFGDGGDTPHFLLLGAAKQTFSASLSISGIKYLIENGFTHPTIMRLAGSSVGTFTISDVSIKSVVSVLSPYYRVQFLDNIGQFPNIPARANATNTLNAIGTGSGAFINSDAYFNVLFGNYTGGNLRTGTENTFVGYSAGVGAVEGSQNVFLGAFTGICVEGNENVAIGQQALTGTEVFTGLSINKTVAIGSHALANLQDGVNNTAVGHNASKNTTSGASNTAYGYLTLSTNISGSNNTAVGTEAGKTTKENDNTYVGYRAGLNVNTGAYNTYLGSLAAGVAATSTKNTGIGYKALYASTATGQVAVGYQAGMGLTTGANNTVIGYSALQAALTETNSVAVGFQAGYTAASGTDNVNVGFNAGYLNATGGYNTHVGSSAGYNSTASFNTYVGYQAAYAASTAANNVAVGYQAGKAITLGGNNTYLGYKAAQTSTTGNNNVAIGYQASNTLLSGTENVSLGYNAGFTNSVGNYNTNVGSQAGYTATGTGNTNVGFKAGFAIATATGNTNIGYQSGKAVTGADNTNIGYNAGQALTSAANSVNVGSQAGFSGTTGAANVNVGYQAGYTGTAAASNVNIGYKAGYTGTGNTNVNIGYNAAQAATTAAGNTVVGYQAGYALTTGGNNTAIGFEAGRYQADGATALTTAVNSVYIGNGARGFSNADNNSIAVGYGAIATGANQASWGNTAITLHTFYGGAIFNEGGGDFDFRIEADTDANLFYIDATGAGLVGIGTNAPTTKLDVNSDAIRVRTTKTPASATAAGDAGTVCWDANFIYVCVAANTWKRVAIATW
jgi:hypothetical protein